MEVAKPDIKQNNNTLELEAGIVLQLVHPGLYTYTGYTVSQCEQ